MQINHHVSEIILTDRRKDKGFNYTQISIAEFQRMTQVCFTVLEEKKKETIGVVFEFSSMSPIAPFSLIHSQSKRGIVNLYASNIRLLLYQIQYLGYECVKKESYLTFHCSKRAGQRKKSPKGAVVSSGARGGMRVQRALGAVIACSTMPSWGVEPSAVTVETSLTELWKGRSHWTKKA